MSATEFTCTVTVDPSSPIGPRDITVTNPDLRQGTGIGVLRVGAGGGVQVLTVSPASGNPGSTGLAVAIGGAGFQPGAAAAFSGSGIAVTAVTFVSASQLQATIDIAASAPAGARDVSVTNPDNSSGKGAGLFRP